MNSISVLDIAAAQLTVAHSPAISSEATAVLEGLSARQKHLPPWLFYDAAGSRLFEEITRLPEYYLTAREHSIFSKHAADMISAAMGDPPKQPLSVVELGAGSASKTLVLLRALVASQGSAVYLPVDVSEAALKWARKNVQAALPTVEVQPICAEITQERRLDLPEEGRRLALYIGSSIGNYDPEEAVELLLWLRSQLQPADALLLGTDMVKQTAPLLAAYNDGAGVTAAFNKNILARLNRELGADFALDAFEHRAVWNADASRMEMHLDSKRNQTVRIQALDRSFQFKRGESIHTESSYKFSPGAVNDILVKSGFALEQSWYDTDRWYGVHLARVVGTEAMIDDDVEPAAA
jgi:L-histidine N-alpha-methyltransferase